MEIAKIDSVNMPGQFSYRPVAKAKRHSVVQTFGGIRVQAPPDADLLIAGDNQIEFSIESMNQAQWHVIRSQYTSLLMSTILFEGYWGDVWNVVWIRLDRAEVGRRLFNIAGVLQITGDDPTPPTAPTASFSGTPTFGAVPLAVQFTDSSIGDVTSWFWEFGDSGTSTAQNPSWTYGVAGSYTVRLTVGGPGGSDVRTNTGYIVVT